MKTGRAGTMTHDYKRHGTTTLFAALNVLDGTVIGHNMQRHRHQEFIRFLNAIEAQVPARKAIHAIVDNYATHKHPKVRQWLARHPRWTFHFTPTSASWLNAVEGFFAKLTKRRLKRGVFVSVVDLQAAINRFVVEHNAEPKPFTWTADPNKIIQAVRRGHQVLNSHPLVTPRVARHRVFVWSVIRMLPDTRLVAIARDDDASMGLLHSRFHEAWSLRLGGRHGVGNDPQYTPTLGFETFPFPEGLTPNIPATAYANDPRAITIAKAAKRLDELRNAWLNPPDLIDIVPEVVPGYPDRILPKTEVAAAELKKRTLTNLYNQRPQWLSDVHRDLDAAVAAAYGWPADISEEDALAKLLELNLGRAGAATKAGEHEIEEDAGENGDE